MKSLFLNHFPRDFHPKYVIKIRILISRKKFLNLLEIDSNQIKSK